MSRRALRYLLALLFYKPAVLWAVESKIVSDRASPQASPPTLAATAIPGSAGLSQADEIGAVASRELQALDSASQVSIPTPSAGVVESPSAKGRNPLEPFSREEFLAAHPQPSDQPIYHDWRHALRSSKIAGKSALLRGLSAPEVRFVAQVALLANFDPDRRQADRLALKERLGWTSEQLSMALAMFARQNLAEGDNRQRYRKMLLGLPVESRLFVMREAALLSVYADPIAKFGIEDFKGARRAVEGLNNETKASLDAAGLLAGMGTASSFAEDQALAGEFGLSIAWPDRREFFAQLPALFGRRFKANLAGFEALRDALKSGLDLPGAIKKAETIAEMTLSDQQETSLAGRRNKSSPNPQAPTTGPPIRITNRGILALRGFDRAGRRDLSRASYPDELVDPSKLQGLRVLDVGSGGGKFVLELIAEGVSASGFDLTLSRRLAGHGSFVRGDAQKLPFADDALDVLYYNWSLFFLDKYKGSSLPFLEQAARVVKPGGRIRIAAVHPENLPALLLELSVFGLKLSPQLELRYSAAYDRPSFYGLHYEFFWKGRRWAGRPFLELVKMDPQEQGAPFVDRNILRAAEDQDPRAVQFLRDNPVVLMTGQHVAEALDFRKVDDPARRAEIMKRLSGSYRHYRNTRQVRIQSVAQIPLEYIATYLDLRQQLFEFLSDKHQVSRKDSLILAGVILQSRGRQARFATLDGPLWRKLESLRKSTKFQKEFSSLIKNFPPGFKNLFMPEPVRPTE